ncbi:helix-turn-helix domain-containing protein [Mumia quercus]|uniref:helix-turn-helix domain-containing protein n=1 Tax=Mumia quercus TaxID=2976125 RepID=UPI0021CF7265|nr:XRE family transcriptional regulator [Mumia quercus]
MARALRHERTAAGLSLSKLAQQAGVAKSTLSQLEAGSANPSVETLWALSTALGIPFSRLVDAETPHVAVVRAGTGPQVAAGEAAYAATLLSACPPHARRDLYLVTAEPGSARRSEPHPRGTVEHVVVSAGRARVGPADDPVVLDPGDYMVYPGDVPHVFEALQPATTAVVVTEQR